ncbi:hypothetical protein V1478_004322 [Vespula squamosa]|uniref:Uncharacterized protein n=1 Tax=Vespula squamosa TaxID=30214 RepID=A0ABD2BI91_VESSQ
MGFMKKKIRTRGSTSRDASTIIARFGAIKATLLSRRSTILDSQFFYFSGTPQASLTASLSLLLNNCLFGSVWWKKISGSLDFMSYDVSDTHDVAKELSIDHETVVNHSKKDGCKKRGNDCGAPVRNGSVLETAQFEQ